MDDGYTIDTFRSAEDALRWLEHGTSDLVITDLRLPGITGLDFARKLRRGRRAQPVIIVTAYGSADLARDLSRAGVADCFSKPFAMDALRRAVRRALAERAARVRPAPRVSKVTPIRPARATRPVARRKAA
jgi:two-component system repressor protein LuxO